MELTHDAGTGVNDGGQNESHQVTKRSKKTWKDNDWPLIALALEWAIKAAGNKMPYDKAALVLGVSAMSLKNALANKRRKMIYSGMEVPPPIPHNCTERTQQIREMEAIQAEPIGKRRMLAEAAESFREGPKGPHSRRSRRKKKRLNYRIKSLSPEPEDSEDFELSSDSDEGQRSRQHKVEEEDVEEAVDSPHGSGSLIVTLKVPSKNLQRFVPASLQHFSPPPILQPIENITYDETLFDTEIQSDLNLQSFDSFDSLIAF